MTHFNRYLKHEVEASLQDSPIVLINGARQVGKTTLAQQLTQGRYISFDDPSQVQLVASSPLAFLQGLQGQVVLDEVQHVPELFPALKQEVDRDRRPGRFILTGSANPLLLPKIAESLAGRMEIHTLWPLSQGEIAGARETFIQTLFNEKILPHIESLPWQDLLQRMLRGGYPEAVRRKDLDRRKSWFQSYLIAVLRKDIQQLANIAGLSDIPQLLRILATRVGSLINYANIARDFSMPVTTVKRYITYLEALYIVHTMPAWFRNRGKRLVKTPKIYLSDTGLLTQLLNLDQTMLELDSSLCGHMLENFVVNELRKQLSWSNSGIDLYHFRTAAGQEVDVVLEAPNGKIVGIEIKSKSRISKRDFNGLKSLQQLVPDRFVKGIILYGGNETIQYQKELWLVPISALWQWL